MFNGLLVDPKAKAFAIDAILALGEGDVPTARTHIAQAWEIDRSLSRLADAVYLACAELESEGRVRDQLTNLEAGLRRLVGDLEQESLDFALVGGLAVSIRGEPRLTRDVVVVISTADDTEAEAAILRMREAGYVPDVLIENDVTGRLGSARLTHPDRPEVVLDMLFASCGIEPEIVDMAEPIEALPDLVLPVARTGHLIAMKLLARDDRQRTKRLRRPSLVNRHGHCRGDIARKIGGRIDYRARVPPWSGFGGGPGKVGLNHSPGRLAETSRLSRSTGSLK